MDIPDESIYCSFCAYPVYRDVLKFYEFHCVPPKLVSDIMLKEPLYWKEDWIKAFSKSVFIIVGAWEGAELFDRFAAYRLGFEIEKRGFAWITLSDRYWNDLEKENRYPYSPIISIGGPVANSVSSRIASQYNLRDRAVGFKKDVRLVGYAWGRIGYETLVYVKRFIENYLDQYINEVRGMVNKDNNQDNLLHLKDLVEELKRE